MSYFQKIAVVLILVFIGLAVTVIFLLSGNQTKVISPVNNSQTVEITVTPKPTMTQKTEAVIVSVGDIFLHDINISAAYNSKTKTYDFDPVFIHVADYLKNADVATAELGGGTYVDKGPFATYPLFKSPISLIETLQRTGFDIAFRTNHTMDFGVEGLNTTSDLLEKNNIVQIAAAKTEENSKKIFIYQKGDLKIAFLGYIYGMNGLPIPKPWMINLIDLEKIKADINLAKKQADFIIVGLHWGNEYQREPSQEQKNQAQQIADYGADLIVASHPHVIQPVYQVTANDGRKVYVAYSLGNFYCGQRERYKDAGVILKYVIEKTGEGTRLSKISYVPTWVASYLENGSYKYTILPAKKFIGLYEQKQAEFLTKSSFTRLKQAYDDTTQLLNKSEINFLEE